VQEATGAPDRELPPTGFVAGVIASRDLRRGPAVSPANERIATAVAATVPVDDASLADLYDPLADAHGGVPPAVNVLRAPPGGGVEVWGARTLSSDPWLRFVSVRRGLSAVERQCHAALQRAAFESNTPALWIQVTQIVLNVLMTLFRTGALRGATPAEAFYVRCDASINPPESVADGRLYVDVGVAIAAPAEFVVFRLGREEGVVEVLE
jgi:phage tail sheath protein FI